MPVDCTDKIRGTGAMRATRLAGRRGGTGSIKRESTEIESGTTTSESDVTASESTTCAVALPAYEAKRATIANRSMIGEASLFTASGLQEIVRTVDFLSVK